MKWMHVQEHLPEEGRVVVCYSEVFQKYYLAYWCPHRGWIDQENDALRTITHWHDEQINFPFSCSGEFDREKAEKYGIHEDQPSKFGYFIVSSNPDNSINLREFKQTKKKENT